MCVCTSVFHFQYAPLNRFMCIQFWMYVCVSSYFIFSVVLINEIDVCVLSCHIFCTLALNFVFIYIYMLSLSNSSALIWFMYFTFLFSLTFVYCFESHETRKSFMIHLNNFLYHSKSHRIHTNGHIWTVRIAFSFHLICFDDG